MKRYTDIGVDKHGCCGCREVENPAEVLIGLRDVSIRRGDRSVLEDVSLDIRRGDFIAVTGPNGGGKTTLLRVILRLLAPTSGEVNYGRSWLHIGYLPQKTAIDSRFPITVRQLVDSGFESPCIKIGRNERRERVVEMLRQVELEREMDYTLGMLSGGQLQRALLGRALVSGPELVVMDEPLSYLDERFTARFYNIIGSLPDTTTVILVSHDMTVLAGMATRHVIVDRRLEFCQSATHLVHYDCRRPSLD